MIIESKSNKYENFTINRINNAIQSDETLNCLKIRVLLANCKIMQKKVRNSEKVLFIT